MFLGTERRLFASMARITNSYDLVFLIAKINHFYPDYLN